MTLVSAPSNDAIIVRVPCLATGYYYLFGKYVQVTQPGTTTKVSIKKFKNSKNVKKIYVLHSHKRGSGFLHIRVACSQRNGLICFTLSHGTE